jgi:hypothetical protein
VGDLAPPQLVDVGDLAPSRSVDVGDLRVCRTCVILRPVRLVGGTVTHGLPALRDRGEPPGLGVVPRLRARVRDLGLPLLGLGWVASASSIFVSFGAMVGLYQFHDRRRRRQFLQSRLPRAYLPSRT